jgi:hypothetical protein
VNTQLSPANFVEHHSEGVDVTGSGMKAVGQHLRCHKCKGTNLQEMKSLFIVFEIVRIELGLP